jgi:hypothetical protein
MREICTSGSVRDGDGNAPIYSAFVLAQCGEVSFEGGRLGQGGLIGEKLQSPGLVRGGQPFQKQPPEQAREHSDRQKETRSAGNPVLAIG